MEKGIKMQVIQCKKCNIIFNEEELKRNFYVCPKCKSYLKIPANERVYMIADAGSFNERDSNLCSVDFLDFPGYKEKLQRSMDTLGINEAAIWGTINIKDIPCAIFVMDSRFMMASMGSVVGEKITRTFEYAIEHELPVIGFTASGGARMQEGIISLMQMAKCSAAVKEHSRKGLLYVTVLTNPTTGGITASVAMQGDIIMAEPNALVGFAGRRVVEQTTNEKLPDNFQSAEFVYDHGFIDCIVERKDLRDKLGQILEIYNSKLEGW